MTSLLPEFTHTEACGHFEHPLLNPSPFVFGWFYERTVRMFACLQCNFPSLVKLRGKSGGQAAPAWGALLKAGKRVSVWYVSRISALYLVALSVEAQTQLACFYHANKVKQRSLYRCCKMKEKKKEAKTVESTDSASVNTHF